MTREPARDPDDATIRALPTADLRPAELAAIRTLMDAAFGDDDERFDDDDWVHATGGRHYLLERAGRLVGHAAVVERVLHIAGRPLRTGYVEAVAIDPALHGRGLGSRLMVAVDRHILETYELGALGTGRHAFYERLGWRTWQGPSSVRTDGGDQRTPDEDGFILVLATPTTPAWALDREQAISCPWRSGDVW